MKKLILGAVLALPISAPAYADVSFVELANNAGVSYVVSASGSSSGANTNSSSASASSLVDALSGVGASATGGKQSNATTPFSGTATGGVNAGKTKTNFVKITSGPNKGFYTGTTTIEYSQATTVTTGVNKETATVSAQNGVSTVLTSASEGSVNFAGATGSTFGGLVSGTPPNSKPSTSTTTTTWTDTIVGVYQTNDKSGGLPTGALVGSATTTSGTPTANVTTGTTAKFASTDASGTAQASAGAALTGAGSNSSNYTFFAGSRGNATVTWGADAGNAANSASNIASLGYFIELINVSTNAVVSSEWTATTGSGTFAMDFTSGGLYSLIIAENTGSNAANYLNSTGGVGGSGSSAATFSFDITAVPELSTWIMMLAGFGGLGFAGYRRNTNTRILAA